jgi:PHP family Zn ribbon phosphoesterase
MFKTEASKTSTGNWNLQASCTQGHTVFKNQMNARDSYKCPYCGNDVY